MKRIGLVVHPRREIDGLAALSDWCDAHGVELVQVTGRSAASRPRASRRRAT